MTQVWDRKFAPHPWEVSRDRVAADCQWSHFGLVVAWPGWKMSGRLFGGSFADKDNLQKGDPIYPNRLQHCFANNGMGLRGQTYQLNAGDTHAGGPCVAVYEPDVPGFPTGPMTVILHWRKLDTTNRASAALANFSNSPAGYLFLDLPNASGTVRFFYGGGTEPANGLTTNGLTFGDDVWAVTVGARGIELWQNGILRNSNGSNPTRTALTQYWGMFGGLSGIFGSDYAESGCCLLYNRQLDVTEIQALTIDPWTPFRPARRHSARSIAAAVLARRDRVSAIIGG